ncbi:MAG TPA: tRNA pseudouridine(38-40) synthase TruA [Anaerovoracaceae bacterium]|nr:tRNA pseudouridine(38-40) synthase TruA [Anaerovoracaceae bacterium]
MKNVLLTIAYDGTDFCGWQKQPEQRSVQGEVERALSIVCAQPIKINGTSRTDAGVHAYGQRANFTAEFSIPIEKIPMVANGIFASAASEKSRKASGDVAILAAEEVSVDFHARFDAIGKKYIYKINNSNKPDPFQRNYSDQVGRKLNLDAMKQAAVHLVGTRDFKCFQAAGGKVMESTVRTIHSARLVEIGNMEIGFEIIGDGFLYNMVRIITGTLIDVGLGKKTPKEMPNIIDSKDRQRAGHTAPPQGLYLAEIYYKEEKLQKAILE